MGKVTLLDGATGTQLWAKAEENGFRKDPVWKYNIEHPEIVLEVEKAYVAAGSQIITTNTFSVNGPALEKSSSYGVSEVVGAAMKIAKEAVSGTDTKVALDMGPLMEFMEPYGDLEEDEVREIYREICEAAFSAEAGSPDVIILETFIDLGMLAVAAEEAVKFGVPVMCSMSFEKIGKTIMGNSVKDMIEALTPLGVAAVGANCSLGPAMLLPVIREFSEKSSLPVFFKPNAGLPVVGADGKETSVFDADAFVKEIAPALPLVAYVGSCCGSSPEYIRKLKEAIS